MYESESSNLYMAQDVALCNCCGQWTELSEFRRRGSGISWECRTCHNKLRSAQLRRQRARENKKDFQKAVADVRDAQNRDDLRAAATAIIGVAGGLRGFARRFVDQYNSAPAGSQMRGSMMVAAFKLIHQCVIEMDESEPRMQELSDDELKAIIAEASQ